MAARSESRNRDSGPLRVVGANGVAPGAVEEDEEITMLEDMEWNSSLGGVAYTSSYFSLIYLWTVDADRTRTIPQHELYMLDWQQIRRMAYRCNYWYDDANDEGLYGTISFPEHRSMVIKDMAKLFQRLNKFGTQRYQCIKLLCDALATLFEGPNGLGSTKKHEFEGVFSSLLSDFRITVQSSELQVLLISGAERKHRIRRKRPATSNNNMTAVFPEG